MSFDRSAIEKIIEQQTLETASRVVSEVLSGNSKGASVAVLPENFRVQNLEHYMSQKLRFVGHFQTASVEHFAAYMAANKADNGMVFVDKEKMSGEIIFDLGDNDQPLHTDHRASVSLDRTADFSTLCNSHGSAQGQRNFAEFLEDNGDKLTFLDHAGEKELNAAGVLQAVRSVNVEMLRKSGSVEGSYHAEKTALESVTVSDADKLPGFFDFRCTPYHSLGERTIRCRVYAITGSELRFTYRIVNREQLEEDLANEFIQVLTAEMDNHEIEHPIFMGTFNTNK